MDILIVSECFVCAVVILPICRPALQETVSKNEILEILFNQNSGGYRTGQRKTEGLKRNSMLEICSSLFIQLSRLFMYSMVAALTASGQINSIRIESV